ncbi:DUF305 domain-containing protein [Tessaracoccus sp. SD287]|uniref:DUF305 domain-containing protein n=1 Tax=Tessaracoccus sp. SD287 TaxID=2782008 RepID=UPI001A9776E9|nr:DUF305 domain-containing protein [Tessaracoccus sp. SD287]MBO1032286.1 DUF305 domain-containing protein [Tessaracoccus sp. SD287]
MNRIARRFSATAVALILPGALAACSDSTAGTPSAVPTSTSSAPSTASNEAARAGDVMFAQMMIPHHQQAIEMADIALAKTSASQQVRDLATEIKAAQDPEITTMEGWLQDWGVSGAPATMDHGSGGMMTKSEMDALQAAEGAEFDRQWVSLMIKHHEGAVTMAEQVLTTTQNPEVKALAEAVVKTQTEEIARMKAMS